MPFSGETRKFLQRHGKKDALQYKLLVLFLALTILLKVLVVQSCPTPCDPTNCSPPGSSMHGIHQARTLEWVALPSSRVSF